LYAFCNTYRHHCSSCCCCYGMTQLAVQRNTRAMQAAELYQPRCKYLRQHYYGKTLLQLLPQTCCCYTTHAVTLMQ
jgi:hypothetical protein